MEGQQQHQQQQQFRKRRRRQRVTETAPDVQRHVGAQSEPTQSSDSVQPQSSDAELFKLLLDQDTDLLLKIPDHLLDNTHPHTNDGSSRQGGGMCWRQSYAPSTEPRGRIPVILQGAADVSVDDMKNSAPPSPPLLFVRTYNLTRCGSKRMNIGIQPAEDDTEWTVVIELENTVKCLKVRLSDFEWDEMCRAEQYIETHMTTEYNPGCHPPDINCAGTTLSILTLYNEPTLMVKSEGVSIFLQYSTVKNLFGLCSAVYIAVERLNQWLPSIRCMYKEIVNHLRTNSVQLSELEWCFPSVSNKSPLTSIKCNSCVREHNVSSIELREIHAEFTAHKKHLFSKFCSVTDAMGNEGDNSTEVIHPMWDF